MVFGHYWIETAANGYVEGTKKNKRRKNSEWLWDRDGKRRHLLPKRTEAMKSCTRFTLVAISPRQSKAIFWPSLKCNDEETRQNRERRNGGRRPAQSVHRNVWLVYNSVVGKTTRYRNRRLNGKRTVRDYIEIGWKNGPRQKPNRTENNQIKKRKKQKKKRTYSIRHVGQFRRLNNSVVVERNEKTTHFDKILNVG